MIAGALLTLLLAADVKLQPGVARPGDAVMIQITGSTKTPSGHLGSAELVFLAFGVDTWVALVPLSVDLKPQKLSLDAVAITEGGKEALFGQLEVVKPNFRRRQLTVSNKFTNPNKKERAWSAADQKAFNESFDQDFTPWAFTQNFAWPRNDHVSAPFGDLRLFNNKKKSQHFGDDIDGETGDPIYASNDGEVVMVRECFGSGGTVLIHHGGRLFTSYFHMSEFAVKQGERVVSGQPIGKVGSSGRVTGPHLHFGAKLDGKWVDPQSVLRLEWPHTVAAPAPAATDAGVISDQPTSPGASPRTP
ncbi:MAG: M23 family metallopeptidase [Myxococcaceae bacterium]|nr:M23 family metallopeptidase [Myxococcaceae bacterium]